METQEMKKKSQSISYILEIRINSMRNDPVAQIEASSPFGCISIGDKFHHEAIYSDAWHDLPEDGQVFFVKDKSHIIGSHSNKILHSIIICIEARSIT